MRNVQSHHKEVDAYSADQAPDPLRGSPYFHGARSWNKPKPACVERALEDQGRRGVRSAVRLAQIDRVHHDLVESPAATQSMLYRVFTGKMLVSEMPELGALGPGRVDLARGPWLLLLQPRLVHLSISALQF